MQLLLVIKNELLFLMETYIEYFTIILTIIFKQSISSTVKKIFKLRIIRKSNLRNFDWKQ